MEREVEAERRDPAVQEVGERKVLSANELLGRTVVDAGGQEVGAITDLYVDWAGEPTLLALVDVGGVLGIGAKPVLVALTNARVAKGRLMITVGREELERAPRWNEATGSFERS